MKIKYETHSDQVAAEMERGIRSGIFPPGSRLPSIRELADVFQVSTQVIKSAFKLLMERGLLISRSRIGVFVNVDVLFPGMKKLILLNGVQGPYDLNYMERVFGLSENIMACQGFHVQMRSIPTGPLQLAALRYEMHQIEMERPDCLIVNAGMVPPEEIGTIRKCEFPVVFLGDFASGDVSSLRYDLIRERTEERGIAYVDAARRLGCRNICLFGGSRCVEYVRRLVNAVREEGRRYGMNVHVSGGHPGEHVDAEIVKSWKHHIRSVRKKFRPDAFLVDGFGHMELFQQALRELGFRPGGDVQVFCDSDPTPGAVLIRSDYTEFIRSVAAVIRRMIDEPEYHCGILEIAGKIRRVPFRIDSL